MVHPKVHQPTITRVISLGAESQVLQVAPTLIHGDSHSDMEEEEGISPPEPTLETQDTEEGDDSSQGPVGNKRKKKAAAVYFEEDVEGELGAWYKDHPCLYNKGMKEYKNSAMKAELFEKKAAILNPPLTGDQLKTWFDSMRTRYGKLTSPKNGAAPSRPPTDRDKWILSLFGFLENHIVRHKGQSLAYKKVTRGSTSTTSQQEAALSSGDEEEEALTPGSVASNTREQERKNKSAWEQDEDVLMARLMACTQQDEALRQRVVSLIHHKSTQEEARQKFFSYMAVEAREIDPALWDNYVNDAMTLLHRYKAKNREVAQHNEAQEDATQTEGKTESKRKRKIRGHKACEL